MVEAEEMFLQALRGYEEALGPKHISTLGTVTNLGMLYAIQGQIDEAERMYLRAVEGYNAVEGDHEACVEVLRQLLTDLDLRKGMSMFLCLI